MTEPLLVESVTVGIDAPAALVWDVLVDFARYPEWNPFTVRVETTGRVGDVIDLLLPDPNRPGELFRNREWIQVSDAPHHLRYDTRDALDGVHAVRDQWVVARTATTCSYRTTDAFTGELAQVVMDLQGAWVKAGFDAVAWALKERAESLQR